MYTAITLIKQPYEVGFTGNPMHFIWQVFPYGTREQSVDVVVTVRVLFENVFNSNKFEEIYIQKLFPAADGTVKLDVSSIIDPYLYFYTPRPDSIIPLHCLGQRKRYQVLATFDAPGLFPPEWYNLPPAYVPPVYYHAVKGGLSNQSWHHDEFFSNVVLLQKKALRFSASHEKFSAETIQWLYWIYPFDDGKAQTVTYKIYFSDGTTVSQSATTQTTGGKWSVHCAPAGFNQCGLNNLVSIGKSPVKYSLTVSTGTNTVVAETFYTLDSRNFYDAYYLLYRNSPGGLETLRLTGQIDLAGEYTRQMARPQWFPSGLMKNEINEEEFNFTGITGFISREEALKIRDLFLAPECYMIEDDTLKPIVINTTKASFFSNKDNLIAVQIEWQSVWLNRFFTPYSLMPHSRSCPPVEKLVIGQPTKNTLLFIWSLTQPYTNIEIKFTIDAVDYVYQYVGNTGMINQSFINPLTGSNVAEIPVSARTICNPDSNPAEYGPWTNYTFQITGDFPPVAVDDYYSVPVGFTGPLGVSVLDNDYDPDGEEIQAIPATGLFGDGANPGTYTINAQGIVMINNAPQTLTGRQSFTYQIKNPVPAGMTATGTVFINFGSGPQEVFVKWVFRDITYGTAQGGTWMSAEAWLDYFSDAACTVPLDLTGRNITVNANYVATGSQTGGANFTYLAEGLRKLMRSKATIYLQGAGGWDFEIVFTVLPGTGYIAVNP